MQKYRVKDNIGSVRRWRLYNKSSLQNIEFEPYGGIYTADNTTTPYDPIFALHPYDPAAQMYRAPYRMYDPDSARWTTRDPLGMVDGPNMYAYVSGGVVGDSDTLGLFTTEGDCGSKGDGVLGAAVKEACDNLDKWVKPHLKKCMEKRCEKGKIECHRGKCGDCKDAAGYNYKGSHTAHVCVDQGQGPGGFADTVMHEWVHSCGFDGQDAPTNQKPPWG